MSGTDWYPAKGDGAARGRASRPLQPLSVQGSMSRSKQQPLEAPNRRPADSTVVLPRPCLATRRFARRQYSGLWIRMPRSESSTPSLRPPDVPMAFRFRRVRCPALDCTLQSKQPCREHATTSALRRGKEADALMRTRRSSPGRESGWTSATQPPRRTLQLYYESVPRQSIAILPKHACPLEYWRAGGKVWKTSPESN